MNKNILDYSIKGVKISLAHPNDIKKWSYGEVLRPETINYKSYKPEKKGLFDELIFGPVKDYKCPVCGKKYKRSDEDKVCAATTDCQAIKPVILSSKVRRTRMGHIHLSAPIVHTWFLKVDHSTIAKILDIKFSKTEDIAYFKSHIVVDTGGLKTLKYKDVIDIRTAPNVYRDAIEEILKTRIKKLSKSDILDIKENLKDLVQIATSDVGKDYGIDYYRYNNLLKQYAGVDITTGASALKKLLTKINLQEEEEKLRSRISGRKKTNDKLYKRLTIIESLLKSKQRPEWMIMNDIPIIPPELRPLIQLDGGRHSTTDINDLYRRIIIRNNRLKKWIDIHAPDLIVQNEKRMLQEAVDALFDNKRKHNPVTGKDGRPLKSLADNLKGKQGRFRQNLLGKRVDYSGRSVIAVGPDLKMYQCGVPKQMILKLFEPFIIHNLIKAQIASSIRHAKKLLEERNQDIWPIVEKTIDKHPVLLNRAPTLHRLSIQAFEVVMISGKVLRLHPLVTPAFNADFDGDQMAIHVPISPEAIKEARELMLASRNILGPKDGHPIITPTQDMVLGIYYLTKEKADAKGSGLIFKDVNEVLKAYYHQKVDLHARVIIDAKSLTKYNFTAAQKSGLFITTVGKLILNESLPIGFPYLNSNDISEKCPAEYFVAPGIDARAALKGLALNSPFTKSEMSKIIHLLFVKYEPKISKRELANIVLDIRNIEDIKSLDLIRRHCLNADEEHIRFLSISIQKHFAKIDLEVFEQFYLVNNETKENWLERIWWRYTHILQQSLDSLKDLGFKFSTKSGITVSVSDISQAQGKTKFIDEGQEYVNKLKELEKEGLVTEDESYRLTIQKWANVKDNVQDLLITDLNKDKDNPLFMMMDSGARGNISNFVQLAGLRGSMAKATKQKKADAKAGKVVKNIEEIPVKSSFKEGLNAFEFYLSSHGARKGLSDTALNTAASGYLTRRLVDASQDIIIKTNDCYTDRGFVVKNIMDTKTGATIVPIRERIIGRYSNENITNDKDEIIVSRNQLIDADLAAIIIKNNISQLEIRAVLGCNVINGVCQMCYGIDLASHNIVNIGEAVGIIASQSIGEPGTQLTMRTFHTGGVAGASDITQGFPRLIELIDAFKKPWGKVSHISKNYGVVESITNEEDNTKVKVTIKNDEINETTDYICSYESRFRVKEGDSVIPGQKITDGPVDLRQLLEFTDIKTVQNYLLKEIQRVYRMQGIEIADKYIEIIIRQMMSKLLVINPGETNLYPGSLINIHQFAKANKAALLAGKKPAFAKPTVIGIKYIPLKSDSFLSAASYQETSKVLVHSSIMSRIDYLEGLKENVILGNMIPAGTGSNFQQFSKYDFNLKDEFPREETKPKEEEVPNYIKAFQNQTISEL